MKKQKGGLEMGRTIRKINSKLPEVPKQRNVAAYARVSSGKEAMLHSLSAQVSYYSSLIQQNPGWKYAGVYVDKAITGTADARPEFQRMIADCRAGKLDMVMTKSVSRFARNTLTLLGITRKLKELGIDVFFEKENIYTMDSKGELLITIMSSLAQEESRSISENVAWGKRAKAAEGELPQYYVEGSHPAIVPAEVYDEVQVELARRKEAGYTAREHCFSGRILCGDCGAPYIEKVWHSTSQYKRHIWQCARKYKNEERCTTPHLYEDEIQTAFLRIMNDMIADKDNVLADYERMVKTLTDTAALDAEGKAVLDECEIVQGLIKQAITENASTAIDQDKSFKRFNALHDRYATLRNRHAEIERQHTGRKAKRDRILGFIERLQAMDGLLTEFDEGLWNATVESITVQADGGMRFRLRDGSEISA